MDWNLGRFAAPLALLAIGAAAGWIVDAVLLLRVRRASAARGWIGGETTARALHGAATALGALAGAYFGVIAADLGPGARQASLKALYVGAVVVATIVAARLAGGLVRLYIAREDTRLPSISIFVNLTRIAVIALGALWALAGLGISIAPLLTALGVGGLAVALALQDTLSNLFAGLAVIASRKIRPGDLIRVQDSGVDGRVLDITWRYTSLEQPAGNLVVVPNSQLGSSTLVNFSRPAPDVAVLVEFYAPLGSDLIAIERVAREVAEETMRSCADALGNAEPSVRFVRLELAGVAVSVGLRAREFAGQWPVRHDFLGRLNARLAEEGIDLPTAPLLSAAGGGAASPEKRA